MAEMYRVRPASSQKRHKTCRNLLTFMRTHGKQKCSAAKAYRARFYKRGGQFLSAAVLNYGDVFHNERFTNPVIPAKAGIQDTSIRAMATPVWMPACAGMT